MICRLELRAGLHYLASEGPLQILPPKSPKAPSALLRGCTRGDCGGLIIPSSSRDHSPSEALMAPTECYAKRSVEHTPRIKHQALSLKQPSKLYRPDTWVGHCGCSRSGCGFVKELQHISP